MVSCGFEAGAFRNIENVEMLTGLLVFGTYGANFLLQRSLIVYFGRNTAESDYFHVHRPSTKIHRPTISNLHFNLTRLIRQIRPQPLLYFFDRHTFSLGIIFHLVSFDIAKVEIFGFGMCKVEPAD